MGKTQGVQGRITVEDRGDTFVVHASYGYHTARRAIGELRPGTEFTAPSSADPSVVQHWRLKRVTEDDAMAVEREARAAQVFPLDQVVEVPDVVEFDDNDDLGSIWRHIEHPEFRYEDLDDLVLALAQYRKFKEGS